MSCERLCYMTVEAAIAAIEASLRATMHRPHSEHRITVDWCVEHAAIHLSSERP